MIFSVVIPVYNDAEGLEQTLKRLIATREKILSLNEVDGLEIIIVDDGSTDGIYLNEYEDEVKLISHKNNLGYGAALKEGIKNSSGELIGYLDADATYPPEYFPKLIEELYKSDADLVIASRMAGMKSDMPTVRYIGNIFFPLAVWALTCKRLSDVTSGMRVFKKTSFNSLDGLTNGFEFTLAFSLGALLKNLKVRELAIPYSDRVGSSKLLPLKDGFRFLRALLSIKINSLRNN